MIAYFDTSAVVPLVIDEPTSHRCRRVWNEAARVVSTRLLYPEACAAVARANRMERLTNANTAVAIADLDAVVQQIDHIELTGELARTAGQLAHVRGLHGYDAVHLAAAMEVADDDVVMVTGDAELAAAAAAQGLATAVTSIRLT